MLSYPMGRDGSYAFVAAREDKISEKFYRRRRHSLCVSFLIPTSTPWFNLNASASSPWFSPAPLLWPTNILSSDLPPDPPLLVLTPFGSFSPLAGLVLSME
ncbi:hypothetical protein D9757_009390 [Collybiopsis confluens]|uniref:Uncharacterized protein n=1 Tax=Collybiopsis confluens TaxID=2823264 RepID=A0A8H5H680_9AGAR|nr:hypothetical protein D9757_009390 [Collybiopsis confluens]